MIDVERLAKAHFLVQQQTAIKSRQHVINQGGKPGAMGHWIINTTWETMEETLRELRRGIARDLIAAYNDQ